MDLDARCHFMFDTPSLLITDDDLEFRQTLCGVFEPLGFRILSAGDGEEALHIVHTEEVHLLLADMHMPKLTGLEMIRRVRQFKSSLPCILMSADLDDLLIEQAFRLDTFDVLPKPIGFRQLTGVVHRALRRIYDWPPGKE
jgi:CheY-like chemotaxis protein